MKELRECVMCHNLYPYDVVHFIKRVKGFYNVCCTCGEPMLALKEQQAIEKELRKKEKAYYLTNEWKALKKKVKKRDNNECTLCGSEDELHVHHIVSKKDGGHDTMDNLLTLCKFCHSLYHVGEPAYNLLKTPHPFLQD